MTADTPNTLISLLGKPLVSQMLSIEVVNFKRAMMDMRTRAFAEEYGVVVSILLPSVDMGEHGYNEFVSVIFCDVKKVCRNNVEINRVPLDLFFEVVYNKAIVTKLLGVN